MQPEILARCASCGAAVREPAMFCPECGKPMASASNQSRPTSPPAASEPAVAQATQTRNEPVDLAGPTTAVDTAAIKTEKSAEPSAPHGARERAREGLHRASSVARGAFEDN